MNAVRELDGILGGFPLSELGNEWMGKRWIRESPTTGSPLPSSPASISAGAHGNH